jgi:hypothetical protein
MYFLPSESHNFSAVRSGDLTTQEIRRYSAVAEAHEKIKPVTYVSFIALDADLPV